MIGWLIRRIGQALLVVLVMTVIVFVGLHAIGNPVDIYDRQGRGPDRPRAHHHGTRPGQAAVAAIPGLPQRRAARQPRQELCLQRAGHPTDLQRLPATLELAFAALIIAVVIGVPLGLFAGLYPSHPLSRLLMTGSVVGFSLPTFWVGADADHGLQRGAGLAAGQRARRDGPLSRYQWSWLTVDGLRHLLLPAINLSLFKLSLVLRLTSAGVREVLPLDFVKFARAKGLSPETYEPLTEAP